MSFAHELRRHRFVRELVVQLVVRRDSCPFSLHQTGSRWCASRLANGYLNLIGWTLFALHGKLLQGDGPIQTTVATLKCEQHVRRKFVLA